MKVTSDTRTITPSRQITYEVTSWPGIEAGPGRRGEFSFRLGRREIGQHDESTTTRTSAT